VDDRRLVPGEFGSIDQAFGTETPVGSGTPGTEGVAMRLMWPVAAGALFAVVRLLVVWPVINPFETNEGDGLARSIVRLSWIATCSAGVSGALLWWCVAGRPPFIWRGVAVGVFAALFGYVGIAMVGLDLEAAIFGLMSTGWITVPSLVAVGVLLGWLQRRFGRGRRDFSIP
jgi:hypothetical protein